MSDTPKVRRDGRCVVCKRERPFTPQRGVPHAAYLGDPFCSALCAKKHFGTGEVLHRQAKGDPARHRGTPIKISRSKHA